MVPNVVRSISMAPILVTRRCGQTPRAVRHLDEFVAANTRALGRLHLRHPDDHGQARFREGSIPAAQLEWPRHTVRLCRVLSLCCRACSLGPAVAPAKPRNCPTAMLSPELQQG